MPDPVFIPPPAQLSPFAVPIIAIIFGVIGWVLTTWIRARHGYPLHDESGDPVHPGALKGDIERLEAALAERDQTIARLEERVRVLERIVTDRRHALREEIDRLTA